MVRLGPAENRTDMTSRMQKLLLLVGILVGITFLWLAFRDTSLEQVFQALVKANFWLIPPFLAVVGLFHWMKAWRWSLLLRPVRKTTTLETFPAVTIGFTGNIMLPAQLGEFVRMYVISRQLSMRSASVLATIFLERIFDFLTIFIILVLGFLISKIVPADLVNAGRILGGVGLALVIVTLLCIIWTERFVAVFRKVAIFLPENLRSKLTAQIKFGAQGLQSVRNPRLLAGAAIISIIQWTSMAICIYTALVALRIDVPLTASIAVLALVIVISTLPNSPGQIGLIQIAFTTALEPYGVSAGDAFAASVFFHIFSLSIILVAVYYVNQLGYSFSGIIREAESAAEKKEGLSTPTPKVASPTDFEGPD